LDSMPHLNPLGYSVLSPKMTEKAFGTKAVQEYSPDISSIPYIMDEMEKFGVEFPIKNPETFTNLPEFYLPTLEGDTIAKHFDNISKDILGDKVRLMKKFANTNIPNPPGGIDLVYTPGWTRYRWEWINEYKVKWVLEHSEKGLDSVPITIFDCETFVKGTAFGHPILATAVSFDSYWVWMHESFVNPEREYVPQLVPLGTTNTLLIAHNVAFDRQRTKEAYYLRHDPFHPTEPFGNLWFDTMSAHINVSGLASEQRFMFTQDDKSFKGVTKPSWVDKGSMNNLIDAYNFHCQPVEPLKKDAKDTRNLFVVANSMSDFEPDQERLVEYALKDVKITFDLYSIVSLKYLQSNPSLTTLYGHFSISSTILPVVDNWYEWVDGCEKIWKESLERQDKLLSELAEQLLEDWKKDEVDVESDPWLSQLDWSANYDLKKDGKPKSCWYGIPVWYRKNARNDKELGRIVLKPITTKSRLSHILLRLKWDNQPIVYDSDMGWTYWNKEKSEYERLPHPSGNEENVGGVLSKDFLPYFESGILSSDLPQAQELIQLAVKVSYWTSVRSRVLEQCPIPALDDPNTMVIVPAAVSHNTASNRSGEALWLTVPSTTYSKIGTEIKSRVQVKSPYVFVNADYDSQEAVIASCYGDNVHKIAGSTQFGHAVLAGTKEDGSDLHSVTAKKIGISRGVAKAAGYGMLFGAGKNTLASTIRRGNKSLSVKEAQELAKKLIEAKKGKRINYNSPNLYGGSDSSVYNFMYKVANTPVPLNPLSGTKMSTAFRPESAGSDFSVMRANWSIQSTGTALLHAFLTGMNYLLKKYKIQARFSMSIHDSILYLCKEEDAKMVAALYQVAHLWSWSWLRYNLGVIDMPMSNAWLSSVEIDKYFRKCATESIVTISQPVEAPHGEAYNITGLVDTLNKLSNG